MCFIVVRAKWLIAICVSIQNPSLQSGGNDFNVTSFYVSLAALNNASLFKSPTAMFHSIKITSHLPFNAIFSPSLLTV
jgi:hypothetical protein